MNKKETKICYVCKQNKSVLKFSTDKLRRDGLCPYCRKCRSITRDRKKDNLYAKQRHSKYPCIKRFQAIKQRCNNPKCSDYKKYGAKDIKCMITLKELEQIWRRDKAYLMKRPSIDRKDSKGNYIYSNCRFIELSENSRRVDRTSRCCKIKQYDLNNNFIKEWNSISEVSRTLNICYYRISNCLHCKQQIAGNFIWRRA